MTTVEYKTGELDSRIFCRQCNKGFGKIIYRYSSSGKVSEKLEETLVDIGTLHESRHTGHKPEVILYQKVVK